MQMHEVGKKWKEKKPAKDEWRKERQKISKFYKKGTKVQWKINVQDKKSIAQPQRYKQHSWGSYSM